jgi:hypothetical protein
MPDIKECWCTTHQASPTDPRSRSSRHEATFMEATSSKRGLFQLENEKKKREPPAAWKSQSTPRGGYIRLRAARDLRRIALSLRRDVCSFRK